VIDAHHHLWDPEQADYPWMTGRFAALRRRYGVEDLVPLLGAAGVDATVAVQARHELAETRSLLAAAAMPGSPIAGVVGWVDLTDPAVAGHLSSLRAEPGGERLVGIRHQVHDEPDPEWLLRSDVLRGLAAVEAADLAFDLLVRSRELPAALAVVRRFGGLTLVIDHLAKPPIVRGEREPWASRLRPFGAEPNVVAKLSGLVTEADWATWRPGDLVPYVAHGLDVFGPERLLFGSDWPVCLLAGSYTDVVDAARAAVDGLTAEERRAIFTANAARTYRLSR
jgi:L-fuconolactonase